MARTFTVLQLVTRAKERADLENSTHIDDSEWKGYLSTAFAQLYSYLVTAGGRQYESTQSISSASLTDNGDGGGLVALPADHLSTTGVYYVDAGGYWTSLEELMAQERHAFSGPTQTQPAIAWALQGTNLVLYPRPPTGQTYKHVYVPQPTDLSAAADGTSVDVVTPDGEDYLVWTMAMFALAKEESDTSVCERYRLAAQERLQEWSTLRSLNNGRRPVLDDGPWLADEGDWRRW